jgi:CubicO group peptidase (beta-lactamase class C family)
MMNKGIRIALLAVWLAFNVLGTWAFGQTVLFTGNNFYLNNNVYTDPNPITLATDTPANHHLNKTKVETAASKVKGLGVGRSLLVVKDGYLCYEAYFGTVPTRSGRSTTTRNFGATDAMNVHSASKSILASLVGEEIRAGNITLDTTVANCLGSRYTVPNTSQNRIGSASVRDLLSMSSGLNANEDQTEYGLTGDFTKGILNLGTVATPGTEFEYLTVDAYLLGAMLQQKTGKNIVTLINENFGQQLVPVALGQSPEGYQFCCANFFITARKLAMFGLMVCDSYRGATEVNLLQSWSKSMLTKQPPNNSYYGYLWWTDATYNRHYGARAWGWGKQFVFVYPNDNLICVVTCNTSGNVNDNDILSSIVGPYVVGALQ